MFVIGVTGGIGTGKSEVCRILRNLGADVISADEIGHEAYRLGTETWRKLVEEFGPGVLTPEGDVDRKILGAIVFKDTKALERLNYIVRPLIYAAIKEQIKSLEAEGVAVAADENPLLVEAGWRSLVDEVWVTTCSTEVAVQRLKDRNGLPREAALERIHSQPPQQDRLWYADVVLDCNGTIDDLRILVTKIWNERMSHIKEAGTRK